MGIVDKRMKSVGIIHITQVRSLLELPVDLCSWIRCWDPYLSTWDCFDRRYLSFFGSSICCIIMDLISSLPGVVLIHASSLSDARISFYTPVLGIVHVSSRPFSLEWVDDLSDMTEFTDESQDLIIIDDTQRDVVDSVEDLVSLAGSFDTEVYVDASVTPFNDTSSAVGLQNLDGSIIDDSYSEVTPLDSVLGVEYRSLTSYLHHVSSQLRVSE